MPIKLYNSETRKKEIFRPIKKGEVGIYVCGVTVYDLCHIGHARSAIVFDVLARYFRARGFKVIYVRNFTDIDDKIIERSKSTGEDPKMLAQRYIQAFYDDMEALGVQKADAEPKATEHINDIIDMINRLVDKGFAYVIDNTVYFSVEKFESYGQLSGRKLEDMMAGARISIDEKKRHPMDFVLWKEAKQGEPQWKSPWGKGRPGWHIECSAMSCKYLGMNFDIHGGGRDLIFPHHENERAQSIAANGVNFANYWIHNGFLTVDSEKMSKSLGNFITIKDSLVLYHPQVLRLFLLSKHYSSPLDFTGSSLSESKSGLIRIYRTLKRIEEIVGPYKINSTEIIRPCLSDVNVDDFRKRFIQIMDDDLNTAAALGLVFEKIHDINRLIDSSTSLSDIKSQLIKERADVFDCTKTLGLLEEAPDKFLLEITKESSQIDTKEIEILVQERDEARKAKNWAKADAIREELSKRNIILEDGPKGTGWRFDHQKPV